MIYVIRVDFYDRTTNTPFSIIKIGYCADSREDVRMNSYRTECPYREVLYTFKGGTKEHETKLHYKFNHLLNVGKEWFIEDPEIHEFFKSATLKDFNNLPKPQKGDIKRLGFAPIDLIHCKINEKIVLDKIESEESKSVAENFIRNFSRVCNFDRKFQILNVLYRFKMIQEEDIPYPFKNLVDTLGIDFVFSSEYSDSDLVLREYNKQKSISQKNQRRLDIKDSIIKTFQVGERYSKSQLKQNLQEIYSKLGMSDKPKATDIEKWFDIKPAKVTNKETGKRDMGFELIKVK